MKTKIILFVLLLTGLLAACSSQTSAQTPAAVQITNTLTETATATPTETFQPSATPTFEPSTDTPTPELPTSTPTTPINLQPVGANIIVNSNVRSWPSKGGENLGGLVIGSPVEVLARNPSGVWYLINYKQSPTGRAWVKANSLTMRGFADLLPIAIEKANHELTFIVPLRWTIFGTPLPLPTLSAAPAPKFATVNQPADVRVCPTASCMIIAYLKKGDQILLNGRTGLDGWGRFIYPSGPNGIGWISSTFIVAEPTAFNDLPYFDDLGNLVTPEPATATPDPNISPTPTMTATSTPAGPLAEITGATIVYSQQSSFSSTVGTLQAGDKINIIRESLNHLWFEIQYPANTTGRGYISAKFVLKLGDFRYLNYTDSNGTPIPTP